MLTIHHAKGGRSVRVIWLCEELGLPYQVRTMPFHPDALGSAEYRALHPLGQIPVLQDGDVTLFESGAILQYLLERYGGGRLELDASDPRRRAEYLQWFHYGEATLARHMAVIARARFREPASERVPEVLPLARRDYIASLQVVDRALETRIWICGDEFSAADIMISYGITNGKRIGELPADLRGVVLYLKRLMQRPAYQRAWSA
jgi:glutathione S-transferase